MSNSYLIDFDVKGDERGSLIALENGKNLPFSMQRVYYIFGTQADIRRGYHAHRALKQVLVCTSGSCQILLDNGISKHTVTLKSPTHGLYIEGLIWHEMFDFSADCVLMVLASELYDEADYIRDYADFLSEIESNHG